MISFYHLGIMTDKNLTHFCKFLTDKGIIVSMELEKEGVALHLSHNNRKMEIFIKLYEKEDKNFEYEMMFKNYEDFKFLHDVVINM